MLVIPGNDPESSLCILYKNDVFSPPVRHSLHPPSLKLWRTRECDSLKALRKAEKGVKQTHPSVIPESTPVA